MDAAGARLESGPESLRDCVRGSAAARGAGMNFEPAGVGRGHRPIGTSLRYRAEHSELIERRKRLRKSNARARLRCPRGRGKRAVEMPVLWKAWKAKSRLPTLSTSPLEISPKPGEIPTFPQLRRLGRMEKWKTKSRFPTFPPPRISIFKGKKQRRAGYRPPPNRGAPRR